jgi:type 1 glutamine amidotransferase
MTFHARHFRTVGEPGRPVANRTILMAMAAMALAVWAPPATAQASIADCPAARTPYSSDSLLIDLLLDPRAEAVLESQGLLKGVPAFVRNTTPPTFAAIFTPRRMLTSTEGRPADPAAPEKLAALDRALAAIPITDEAAVRRCARYDHQPPAKSTPDRRPAILVFEKINGFKDTPSVDAAHKAFADMAARRGWSITFTDNGAVFNKGQLRAYDAVVWNNVSGDVLTLPQRKAFQDYLAAGGGFAGVHGAGGDPIYLWDWYPDALIGARFAGHPLNPHFQAAKVVVEGPKSGIVARLPDSWTMTEEWYSFAASPRAKGVHVLAHLDEATYQPGRLAMGDHPIAWTHCLGDGRAFYTAIGHRPESYVEPNSLELLEQGIAWAAAAGDTTCRGGREVAAVKRR